MSNRRRSERFTVSLPVTLKDSKGGEITTTANVSAHGLAVFTTKPRPLRQYLELEVELPANDVPINITAVVARHAEALELGGSEGPGLGLDFFLFDARAKQAWSTFLGDLRTNGSPAPAPAAPIAPRLTEPDSFDDTPTFIIKPRDLGRLWAFYRGEMTKGRVRIETPILKPVGTPVELLVVHPSSQSEWILQGHIATTNENARGGRPVLEIELDDRTADLKSDFRSFVATGRGMIEEDISLNLEMPSAAPSRIPSGPHPEDDFANEEDSNEVYDARPLEPSGSGSAKPVDPTSLPVVPTENRVEEPARFDSVVIDLDNLKDDELRSDLQPIHRLPEDETLDREEPLERLDPDFEEESEPTLTPHSPEVKERPALAALMSHARAPSDRSGEAKKDRSPFAAFFEEAAEADAQKRSIAPMRVESTRRLRPPPMPPMEPVPRIDDLTPPKTGLRILSRQEAELAMIPPPPPPISPPSRSDAPASEPRWRALPPDIAPDRSPPPPPLPTGDEPLDPLPEPDVMVVRGAPAIDEPAAGDPVEIAEVDGIAGEHSPKVGGAELDVAHNPPIPPNTMFDYQSAEEVAQPLSPRSIEAVLPPSARRKAMQKRDTVERDKTGLHHSSFSTEGSDPHLDRDIALARARVVRSPNSVTAVYRLSTLLVQRGDHLDDALESLKRVTELEPNHPGAHHKLAEVLARRGEYAQALDHLNRARRLGYRTDPDLEALVAHATRGS
jgi:hypothetical protein